MPFLDNIGLVDRAFTPRLAPYRRLRFPILLIVGATALAISIALEKFYVVGVLVALPLLILYPVELSLGVFAFLIPYDSILVIGQSGYTLNWFVGAVAGGTLFAYGLVSARLKSPPRVTLWWGFFVLWSAATLLWALAPGQGLKQLPSAACLFLLYLVAVSFRVKPRELTAVVLLTIAGGVFAAGYAATEFAHGTGWFSRASLIINGREANPNDFADSLLLPFSLALGEFLSPQSALRRGSMLVAAAVIAFCILLTMSRGSVLALSVMLLVYMIRLGVRGRLVVPIMLVSGLLMFLPNQFFLRVQQAKTSRAQGRLDIWIVGTQIVEHYGIFGAGLQNFRVAYNKFAGSAPNFRGFEMDPHNIYLQVWAEMGIIGLILFLAAICSQIKSILTANRDQGVSFNYLLLAVEAACWALLVHGLAANLLWRKQFWMLWILLSLVLQLQHASRSAEQPAGELR